MTMLKSLYIQREGYGADKGKLTGQVEFQGLQGQIAIRLNHPKSQQLLELLAPELISCAQETAKLMVAEILDDSPAQLEHYK